jgi:hypothetical protein
VFDDKGPSVEALRHDTRAQRGDAPFSDAAYEAQLPWLLHATWQVRGVSNGVQCHKDEMIIAGSGIKAMAPCTIDEDFGNPILCPPDKSVSH